MPKFDYEAPCTLCGVPTIVYFEHWPVCVMCEVERPAEMWALLDKEVETNA